MSDQEGLNALPERMTVPAIALSGILVFPYALTPLVIEGEESIELVQKEADGDRVLSLFPEYPQDSADTSGLNLRMKTFTLEGKKVLSTGVLGRIVKLLRFPDNTVRILIRGLCRIKESSYDAETRLATFRKLKESEENEIEKRQMHIKQFVVAENSPIMNKTIKDSGIRNGYHCLVVGVEKESGKLLSPEPTMLFEVGDVVWVVGEKSNLYNLVDKD